MNLSFLSPLFFIGLVALALPIIAHLISRKSGVRKSFPAINFLISSQGDLATRSRLKDLILLLLRALILVLIVLIFAKPAVFSFSAKTDNTPKSIAIVIDNSFSMGYENNFENAQKKAKDIIDLIPDGSFTLVAPLVINNEEEKVTIQQIGSLKRDVQDIKLSNSYTNNNKRLLDIYSKLQKTPNETKELIFITDLQQNGWQNKEFEFPWLEIIDISARSENPNHAVTDIDVDYNERSIRLQSTISNFSDDTVTELLTKTTLDDNEIRENVDIRPNDSIRIEVNFRNPDNLNSTGSVETKNDKIKVDDIRYFISDGVGENPKNLVVDGDPREDSRLSETYYLTQALETISETTGTQVTIIDNGAFLSEELSKYGVIYLANVGDITPRAAKELENFVVNGGTAVIFLGNSIRASSYNTLLKTILPVEIQSIYESNASLSTNNSRVFSKEISNKISQIQIEKLFNSTAVPEAEVLIYTSDESPFLVTKQYGIGNTFIFTSTVDTSWNNLSITPVFLPIIKKIYDIPTLKKNKGRHYLVNDVVKIDSNNEGKKLVVIDPLGDKHNIGSNSDEFKQTMIPGIYTVVSGGEFSYKFAVNIDPRESNLEKLPKLSEENELVQQASIVKVFKEIWRYFLWGVIALFVSESLCRAIFR